MSHHERMLKDFNLFSPTVNINSLHCFLCCLVVIHWALLTANNISISTGEKRNLGMLKLLAVLLSTGPNPLSSMLWQRPSNAHCNTTENTGSCQHGSNCSTESAHQDVLPSWGICSREHVAPYHRLSKTQPTTLSFSCACQDCICSWNKYAFLSHLPFKKLT